MLLLNSLLKSYYFGVITRDTNIGIGTAVGSEAVTIAEMVRG